MARTHRFNTVQFIEKECVAFYDDDIPVGVDEIVCPTLEFEKDPIFFTYVMLKLGVNASVVFVRECNGGKVWNIYSASKNSVIEKWFSENRAKICNFIVNLPLRKTKTHFVAEINFKSLVELDYPGINMRMDRLARTVKSIRDTGYHLTISVADYLYVKSYLGYEGVRDVHATTTR